MDMLSGPNVFLCFLFSFFLFLSSSLLLWISFSVFFIESSFISTNYIFFFFYFDFFFFISISYAASFFPYSFSLSLSSSCFPSSSSSSFSSFSSSSSYSSPSFIFPSFPPFFSIFLLLLVPLFLFGKFYATNFTSRLHIPLQNLRLYRLRRQANVQICRRSCKVLN